MRLLNLEQQAREKLDCSMVITQVSSEDRPARLTGQEQSHYSNLKYEHRKRDWLLGRSALKQVLSAFGRSCNTLELVYRHPQFSLTHADQLAFSAGSSSGALGIGIDFEPRKKVNPEVGSWFLKENELDWLRSQNRFDDQLVRLWTIKEAAFKSLPNNSSMMLKDFTVSNPENDSIRVSTPSATHCCEALCIQHLGGFLSVAT